MELIKVDSQLAKNIDGKINEIISLPKDTGGFERMMYQASAIELIEQSFSDEYFQKIKKSCCGKKIGFQTDKDKEAVPYSDETIKKCIIEACITGVQIVGNQFNILAGNMYVTKEGFTYLLSKRGIKYDIRYELPQITEGTTANVKCTLKFNGRTEVVTLPVYVNKSMKSDAVLGKAERKAKKWLWAEVSGNDVGDGDTTVEATYEVVEETTATSSGSVIDDGLTPEERKKYDDFLLASTSLESLDKRLSQVVAKFPNYNKSVYETKKSTFA